MCILKIENLNFSYDKEKYVLKDINIDYDYSRFIINKDRIYYKPDKDMNLRGLRILRNGLLMG